MPTIGFNMETVVYKNLQFNVWDLGGQTNIRPYWRCYYANTDAIIYVRRTHAARVNGALRSYVGGVRAVSAPTLTRSCPLLDLFVLQVVDSTDQDRLSLTRKELLSMLEEDELKNAILLVFANKMDMKGAASEVEVSQSLGLHAIKDRQWHICKTSALHGQGLTEGLEWLSNAIAQAATGK